MADVLSQQAQPRVPSPEALARFAALEARVAASVARAAAAEVRVVESEAENGRLRERVRELEARLMQESSNSSKPPSSEVFRRGRLTAKKTYGKAGGQRSHMGATRIAVWPERGTERKDIRPTGRGTCHRDLKGAET